MERPLNCWQKNNGWLAISLKWFKKKKKDLFVKKPRCEEPVWLADVKAVVKLGKCNLFVPFRDLSINRNGQNERLKLLLDVSARCSVVSLFGPRKQQNVLSVSEGCSKQEPEWLEWFRQQPHGMSAAKLDRRSHRLSIKNIVCDDTWLTIIKRPYEGAASISPFPNHFNPQETIVIITLLMVEFTST